MPSPLEGASCAACHDAPREGGSWAAGQNNDIAVICGCLGQIWHEAWLERRQCPCSGSVLLLDRDSINWWIIGYPNSCRTIYGQTQLRSKQIRASLDTWSSCAGELPLPQFSSQDDGDPRTHKIDIGIRGNARPLAGSINNDDSCSCLIHATLLWSPNFLWRVEFPHSQNPRQFVPRSCFHWTVVKGCFRYTESSGGSNLQVKKSPPIYIYMCIYIYICVCV